MILSKQQIRQLLVSKHNQRLDKTIILLKNTFLNWSLDVLFD